LDRRFQKVGLSVENRWVIQSRWCHLEILVHPVDRPDHRAIGRPGVARHADAIHLALTGEPGYFDSRVVYVSETGPKDERRKRLAIMDYDGANTQYLTDSASIVLALIR
jgi:hypothetical protein